MDFSRIKYILKYTFFVFKILCIIFACICLISGLIPLMFFGHLNVGNVALLAYGFMVFFVILIKPFGKPVVHKIIKIARYSVSLFLTICFTVGLLVSIFMIKYAFFNEPSADPDGKQGTVVVLGCKINGLQPSTTLKGRLDAAYRYLTENEDVVAIVSGGQGIDELASEAYVMKTYLVERGISEERIIMEDKSTNTDENIKFSGAIIEELGLPGTMYIVTDTFHSCRGYMFAQKNGYDAKNISADIYWPLMGEYWVRDLLGVLHMTLTPNWELDL